MTPGIHAASSPGEVRVAVTNTRLADYAIWRPGAPDGVGDLHRGRVVARVRAMAGSFVAIANAEGFLPDSETPTPPAEGTLLGVRITRAAQGGKGPRLSAKLSPEDAETTARGACRLVRRAPGALERLAALWPALPIMVDDPALAAALKPRFGDNITLVAHAFAPAVEDAVAALASPYVPLPGGGRLTIQPTAALVAIDADSGSATAGPHGKRASQTAFNLALLCELARQIRLRNLSGAILVDLAGLPARKRATLAPALAAELSADPAGSRLLGFTQLGLAEIVRGRVHPPLHELLAGPHAAALAALRAAVLAAADRGTTLHMAPAVLSALEADPVARADLARSAARAVIMRSDPTLPPCAWRLDHTESRP